MFAHVVGRHVAAALALCAVLASGPPAPAAPIAGNGFLGDFTGDFSYNAATHTVSVTLTNAATTAPGGRITGFAFNLPGQPGAVTGVTYTPPGVGPGSTFSLLGGTSHSNGAPVNPYGDADVGAALGGDWLGGGSPAGGLAVGQSATWTFLLSGNNAALDALTAQQIYEALTTGGGQGQANFLVRFRGFDNGGSDKVPGGDFGDEDPPVDPTGDPTIPEPTSLAAFALVGGLGLLGRRYFRKPAAA
jgi:hypothetical protein